MKTGYVDALESERASRSTPCRFLKFAANKAANPFGHFMVYFFPFGQFMLYWPTERYVAFQ